MVITTFTDLLGTNADEIYQGSEMFIYRSSVYSSGLSLSEKKHLGMKLYVQNSRGHMNSQKFTMQKVKPYKKKCTPLLSLNIRDYKSITRGSPQHYLGLYS